jgi:hypothetical protein
MNLYERSCNESKLGVKAYQNLLGSLNAFNKLIGLITSNDHIVLSSVFCFAVVKYAKPFIETGTSFGKTRYPTKHLQKTSGFSKEIHDHLVALRNTLVAHDDLESIEPRILKFCVSINESSYTIPVSIAISNKCLAYPADLESACKLRDHVSACVKSTLDKLNSDLANVRQIAIAHPEQATTVERYRKNYGQEKINVGGSQLHLPDFMSDEWLNANQPDFTHIHNGFQYEELKVRRDFYGPERIKLPSGEEIEIVPNNPDIPG